MPRIIKITDLNLPELSPYANLTRAQLENKQHPDDGLFIAESVPVIEAALLAGFIPVSMLMEQKKADVLRETLLARCPDIPVYTAAREVLAGLTGYALTRGVLCAMRRQALPDYASVCRNARRVAVLEGVTDTTNMGAIFRSAAALGMDGILLTQTSCDPLARRSLRVSMGCVFKIPWAYLPVDAPIQAIKSQGFHCAAMALNRNSIAITDPLLHAQERLAIVLGTEGTGLLPQTIAECDSTVMIPMHHGVDSLNVATAAALAFWEIGKA